MGGIFNPPGVATVFVPGVTGDGLAEKDLEGVVSGASIASGGGPGGGGGREGGADLEREDGGGAGDFL